MALDLTAEWYFYANGSITSIEFEDGYLGVSSEVSFYSQGCAYIFLDDGTLIDKKCIYPGFRDVSYCCDKFIFISPNGITYIYDLNAGTWSNLTINNTYAGKVKLLSDGFVACDTYCGYFYFDGTLKWSMPVNQAYSIDFSNVIVVADQSDLLFIDPSNGALLDRLTFNETIYDIKVCSDKLIIGKTTSLTLYSLDADGLPLREEWSYGGLNGVFSVDFSPDCNEVIISDRWNWAFKIFDLGGNLLLDKGSSEITAVGWGNKVATGSLSGSLVVYSLATTTPSQQSEQPTEQVEMAIVPLAIPMAKLLRRRKSSNH